MTRTQMKNQISKVTREDFQNLLTELWSEIQKINAELIEKYPALENDSDPFSNSQYYTIENYSHLDEEEVAHYESKLADIKLIEKAMDAHAQIMVSL